MWFSVALWTVFAFLVCSTVAYSSSSHHSGFQDYDSTPQKTHPSYIGGKAEEDPWTSLSRGIFEGKATSSAAESSASDDANLLATLEDSDPDEPLIHEKRDSHSLSIVNPLDVLRQRLMLEMARRRMKENQDQIRENAVILKNLGKRGSESEIQDQIRENAVILKNIGKRGSERENYLRRIHVFNNEDFDV